MRRPTIKVRYHRIATPGFMVQGKQSDRITVANGFRDIRLHCFGPDDQEINSFKLPADPARLRELAAALGDSAQEIEDWRSGNLAGE